jgi:hypothetical protein
VKIVCINWCNYLGRGAEYVAKLQSAVARNLTIPHEFICLTEKDLGEELKGWWVKMKLAEIEGPAMYLDLDVMITDNIDHIARLALADDAKLWMRDDFSYSVRNPKQGLSDRDKQFLGGDGCFNSSVMVWSGDALAPVREAWANHSAKYMAECHGDQNVISQIMRGNIGFLPDECVKSYKYHWLRGLGYGPITVCHGQPKPHELTDEWVKAHW